MRVFKYQQLTKRLLDFYIFTKSAIGYTFCSWVVRFCWWWFCRLGRRFQTGYLFWLEIPASLVFLGADAQLLGTSLASARMPLSISLKNHNLNWIYIAQPGLASLSTVVVAYIGWALILASWSIYVAKTKHWPFWPSSGIKAKWKLQISKWLLAKNLFIFML